LILLDFGPACSRPSPRHDFKGLHGGIIRLRFTDLGGAASLTSDKHAGVVRFGLAYDVLSTLPNWDNLRLLDSEVLGGHLLDRLHMRLRHYRSLERRSLRTLKRSR
jgi:hypothetical protein